VINIFQRGRSTTNQINLRFRLDPATQIWTNPFRGLVALWAACGRKDLRERGGAPMGQRRQPW
jgi:hypothetical protein